MTLAVSLDIMSSWLGLFSALFFCVGILHFDPSKAEQIATKMWGRGMAISEEMLVQKADFIVGAILLVLSFSIQFTIKAFPSFFELSVTPSHITGVVFAVAASTTVAIVSRIVGFHLGKLFLRQLQKQTAGKL